MEENGGMQQLLTSQYTSSSGRLIRIWEAGYRSGVSPSENFKVENYVLSNSWKILAYITS